MEREKHLLRYFLREIPGVMQEMVRQADDHRLVLAHQVVEITTGLFTLSSSTTVSPLRKLRCCSLRATRNRVCDETEIVLL